MKKMRTVTNESDFEYFKKKCYEWQRRLGLTNYELKFQHSPNPGAYAAVNCSADGKVAIVNLTTDWGPGFEVSKGRLEKNACHEMLHVLLADYADMARARFSQSWLMDQEEEALIRRLETALIPLFEEEVDANIYIPMSEL